jgi:O-antigen/teichoic acid export membrane protein
VNKNDMGYKYEAIKGFSWMGILRIATRLIAFFKTILLATILLPTQFGVYGIALLVLGLLEVLTETGVNIFLIQEDEIDEYINSAWVVSIIRGIIIAVLIIFSAPFIASFFNAPEATSLLYVISIVPFLRGFINPSIVKFQKHLQFNKEFFYRFAILVVDSVVAVVAALLTHSPIGIVIGLLAGVLVEVVLSHVVIKPKPSLVFNKIYIYKIFHRGKWITMSSVGNYLFYNADNIIVGKLLGTGALGIYQIAYALSLLPITEIAESLSKVTLPIFIKLKNDKDRLKKAFFKMIGSLVLLTVPFGLLLFIFPAQIIMLILGDKWLAASEILPLLAIFGVMKAISHYSSTLFLAVNKQEYASVITIVSIGGLMIPIVPLVLSFGLVGAATSALIGSLVAVPFVCYFCWRTLRKRDI